MVLPAQSLAHTGQAEGEQAEVCPLAAYAYLDRHVPYHPTRAYIEISPTTLRGTLVPRQQYAGTRTHTRYRGTRRDTKKADGGERRSGREGSKPGTIGLREC
eukprot:3650656-Rhodomonas_salina.2